MKLVVATEVIRQSLSIPAITSVIALARRPVSVTSNLSPSADPSKLHSVILEDYGSYPNDVKKQIAGADACIWTVAISPSESRNLPPEEIRRVCQEHTLAGLEAMSAAYRRSHTRYLQSIDQNPEFTKDKKI